MAFKIDFPHFKLQYMDKNIFLSKNKLNRLKDEYEELKNDIRQREVEKTEYGHMHESIITDVELGAKRNRYRKLQFVLKYAKVLPSKVNSKNLTIGSRFKLKIDQNRPKTYKLVHPLEADPQNDLLSIKSPLGKHLKGKEEGMKFKFNNKEYKIIEILNN